MPSYVFSMFLLANILDYLLLFLLFSPVQQVTSKTPMKTFPNTTATVMSGNGKLVSSALRSMLWGGCLMERRCRGEGVALGVAGGGVVNICRIIVGSLSMEF